MDDHPASGFVADRADLLQEMDEVGAKLFLSDVPVAVQLSLELFKCETFLASGQPGYDVAGESLLLTVIHRQEEGFRLADLGVGIFIRSPGTPEYEYVEGDHCRPFVAKGLAAVRHDIFKVRPGPVEDRHEVVGDRADAAGGEIPDRGDVVGYVALATAFTGLDLFVYGNTLDHRPFESALAHLFLPAADFFDAPDLPVGDVMQSCDYLRGSCLQDVGKGDRVLGTVPSHRKPCLVYHPAVSDCE